jgi:hypothetical protein
MRTRRLAVLVARIWFDEQAGIAAVGWYEKGTRFLDATNPSRIRQVGYYLPANGSTWAALGAEGQVEIHRLRARCVPRSGRPEDQQGGRDSKTRRAPTPRQWYATGTGIDGYLPSKRFGYLCPLPRGRLLAP